jgi:hypothetical protein
MRFMPQSAFAAAAVLAAAAFFAIAPTPAAAFGEWFARDGIACDMSARAHVVERTVRRRVVKRPGVYVLGRKPGLYGWQKVRVKLDSGRVVWAHRRVLMRSYRNVNHYHPGKTRWTHERQYIVTEAPPRPRRAWPDRC